MRFRVGLCYTSEGVANRRKCGKGRFWDWELSARTCAKKTNGWTVREIYDVRDGTETVRCACIHNPRSGVSKCIGQRVRILMEDGERWNGMGEITLVHRVACSYMNCGGTWKRSARKRVEETCAVVKRNGEPIGIVIVINSRHLWVLHLVNVTHRAIQLIPPTQGTAL